jgi:hypothetical protein
MAEEFTVQTTVVFAPRKRMAENLVKKMRFREPREGSGRRLYSAGNSVDSPQEGDCRGPGRKDPVQRTSRRNWQKTLQCKQQCRFPPGRKWQRTYRRKWQKKKKNWVQLSVHIFPSVA